ncbi:MAG TPA: tetratricopeptide repeat protein [Trinickia sp.]|jgi:tetratricopeptide (TPR) repeat protein|nr:tetratricopeptide repeat protein [Trinickia sp.]
MKPSSGRAHRTAALAANALFCLALAALPGPAAHAQVSPATADGTPQIDAAIAGQDWNAALAQLDARIASNPRDAQAKFKRGTVLARLNRDDDAIRQFTELTQTYPELPEPYNNLAALYAKHGRYEEARAALETAVKANPSYGLAYENLGDLYLRLAAESYKRAQRLGHPSGATAQRLADIERIVSKTATEKAQRKAAPAPRATTVAPPAVQTTPGAQFGGANGPLATPPYVTPPSK